MNIGEILVRFGADIGGFMSGIRTAAGALGSFGAAVIAASAVVAGLAVIIGGVSVKAAGDFQQGLNRLVTGAGDVTDNMKVMGQGILNVSTATGILTSGTSGLNAAMYLVISSGQRGAQALTTLKAAAQGAQIEQANMVAVTQILTTLQTNFGLHTYTATQYMNGLVAAVAHGKISLEDLSTAMSPILPNAHQLGIHFADVAAAMADMTNQGIPADQAATALRFVMQSMILPTHASAVAMREWGLDTNKVAAEMKVSLPGAIQMYIDAAKRAGPEGSKPFLDALAEMMGGGQRAAKALYSLSQSMGTWRSDIAAVNTALGLNSSAVMGWELVQGSFNIKLDQTKAILAAVAIAIGTQLLPVLGQLLGQLPALINDFSQAVAWFRQFAPQVAQVGAAFSNLSAALAPSAARMQQAGAAGNLLAGALGTLRLIIIGILAGIALLVNGIASVIQWFNAGGPAVQRLYTMFQQLGAIIMGAVIPAWRSMQTSFADAMAALRPIMPQLQLLAQILGGTVVVSIILVISVLVGLITAFAAVLAGITRIVAGIIQIFAGMVTSITGFINLMSDLLTGRFDRLGADLDQIMQGIVQMFIGAWNVIAGLFQVVYGLIVGFTSGFVSSLEALFNGLFQTLVGGSIIPDMCNAIVAAFTGMISMVLGLISSFISGAIALFANLSARAIASVVAMASALIAQFRSMVSQGIALAGALVNGVASTLGRLAGIAINAGLSVANGIANGIRNGIGAAVSAAQSLASAVANFLPHSPAKEGPLRDLNKFGPAMTHGFAAGIIAGSPEVKAAVTMMVQPMSGQISGPQKITPPQSSASPAGAGGSSSRPIIIQVGNREYRAFIDNLGNDLVGSSTVRVHFAGGR